MAVAVYELRQSVEEYRPTQARLVSGTEYERRRINECIVNGETGYDLVQWTPLEFECRIRGKKYRGKVSQPNEWDCHQFSEFNTLLSARAIDVLAPSFGDRFTPLPVTLEGESYFCLASHNPIDCLDVNKSEIEYASEDAGGGIMRIKRYAFKKRLVADPAVFTIPQETFFLFVTESIPQIVQAAGLKGFRFLLADGPRPVAKETYTYHNEYFRIEVDIPDTWTVLTWRKGNCPKGTRSEPCTFQQSDDDLSTGHRRLFLAQLYRPLDDSQEDGRIELSVWPGDDDFAKKLVENAKPRDKSGKWTLGGKKFDYVDSGLHRFACRRFAPGSWLYIRLKCARSEFRDEAIRIMETMRPLKRSRKEP